MTKNNNQKNNQNINKKIKMMKKMKTKEKKIKNLHLMINLQNSKKDYENWGKLNREYINFIRII